jgi:hypothetical protein
LDDGSRFRVAGGFTIAGTTVLSSELFVVDSDEVFLGILLMVEHMALLCNIQWEFVTRAHVFDNPEFCGLTESF